jgi:hypothetical protein
MIYSVHNAFDTGIHISRVNGRGLDFFGPCEMASSCRRVPFGPKKVEFFRAQTPPTCPSNEFARIKSISFRTEPYNQKSIGSFMYMRFCILYSVFCIFYSLFCVLCSVFCVLHVLCSMFRVLRLVFCILYSVVYVVSLIYMCFRAHLFQWPSLFFKHRSKIC